MLHVRAAVFANKRCSERVRGWLSTRGKVLQIHAKWCARFSGTRIADVTARSVCLNDETTSRFQKSIPLCRDRRAACAASRAAVRGCSMKFAEFKKAGHWPTLLAAFLYFDISFMAWVALGPLIVYIVSDMNLAVDEKFTLVAIPVLAGA